MFGLGLGLEEGDWVSGSVGLPCWLVTVFLECNMVESGVCCIREPRMFKV